MALTTDTLEPGRCALPQVAIEPKRSPTLERSPTTHGATLARWLDAKLAQIDDRPTVAQPGQVRLGRAASVQWEGFRRTPPDVEGPLEHVPLREIVNAMVAATRAAAGMTSAELNREVLGVFGGRRLTSGIAARLNAALRLGVQTGRIRIEESGSVVVADVAGR